MPVLQLRQLRHRLSQVQGSSWSRQSVPRTWALGHHTTPLGVWEEKESGKKEKLAEARMAKGACVSSAQGPEGVCRQLPLRPAV